MGTVIFQNNKPISYFSLILSKAQLNYTTTLKELLSIVEFFKKIREILFGYEIEEFFDHKNLVYEAKISTSQRFMGWRLILEEFVPNIRHIAVVDNIVADTLSCLPLANINQEKSSTMSDSCQANELFACDNDKYDKFNFLLALTLLQRGKQKELNQRYTKLKLKPTKEEYQKQDLDGVKLIFHKR